MLHCWNFIFKYFSVFNVIYTCVWELENKKGWVPKNRCLQTAVLEKTLESPLDSKEIKPVNHNGSQPWMFTGRTNAEAEAPIFWPLDVKSQVTRKDPEAGKGWGQAEKGVTEDEIVRWHHWLNGREFAQTLGKSEGQGNLVDQGVAKSQTPLSVWTTTTTNYSKPEINCKLTFS